MTEQLKTMPQYGSYEDSGVKWLGEIPKHWKVKRLAAFGTFSKGGGFSKSDLTEKGTSAVLYGDIYTKYEYIIDCAVRNISSLVASNSVTIVRGDLLFTGSGETKEDIGKCVAYNSNDEAKAGGDILIFKQKDNNTLFLSYCLNTHGIAEEKAKSSKGEIIVHTYASKLKNLYIPIPPQPEQTAIANFLDQKTTKIDQAIAIKEKQITLLKERKQILIQNAVTRGLNPDAPMRDSGVEWIGDIPDHWKIIRLKFLFSETNERTKTGEEVLFSLRMKHGLVPHEDVSDKYISDEHLIDYKVVYSGQMIMNRMRAAIGIFGLATGHGLVSPDYAVFDIGHNANPEYFLRLFKIPLLGTQFRLHSKGLGTGSSGFMRLYTENFSNIKIALPSVDEQGAIVKYIETESNKIDKAISLQQQQIEKLKEYKATLINSAVTGKIKVT